MEGEELVHLITRIVLQLALIVAAAKIAGEISERYLRIPPVLGELAAGIIIGPFALGGIGLFGFEPIFGLPPTRSATTRQTFRRRSGP